jgi:hypothetical protein
LDLFFQLHIFAALHGVTVGGISFFMPFQNFKLPSTRLDICAWGAFNLSYNLGHEGFSTLFSFY